MNTELEHLKKMRDLLAKGWTQETFARDAEGNEVSPYSPAAASFCLYGAYNRVAEENSLFHGMPPSLLQVIERQCHHKNLDVFNDVPGRTQAEILALIDRAIKLAEAEQWTPNSNT